MSQTPAPYPAPPKPQSVEELTAQNVRTIAELESAAKSHMTFADHISSAVAKFCGSMTFVWVHLFWFGGWITWNVCGRTPQFDPFPFTFLTLIVSLEAIFLSTFILISQNQDSRLNERRNHLDLQVNLLSEQENTKMLMLLGRIAGKLGVAYDDDPSLEVLEQATSPHKLVEQIESADLECGPDPSQPASGSKV